MFMNRLFRPKARDFSYFFQFKKLDDNFDKLWRMKSSARDTLKEWLLTIPYDAETSSTIANACSELIENCIKYSSNNTSSLVEIFVYKEYIFIETSNYSDKAQIQEFKRCLQGIHENKGNLPRLYIKKLENSQYSGFSQLGLIKILMETHGEFKLLNEHKKNLLHTQLKIKLVNKALIEGV